MSYFYRPSLITLTSDEFRGGTPLVLSDHGRSPLKVGFNRIENRKRMASGRMRSKFVADKRNFSVSWEQLPSRSFVGATRIVADGYASATDLAAFYEDVSGEFTLKVYADRGTGVALDKDGAFGTFRVFFDSFDMEFVKRGRDFDFYDVDLSLEEA